ncbi:MAG: D-Ala-D-Ala carboxypeptidase family metallohydrolase [Roseovarius sp.]
MYKANQFNPMLSEHLDLFTMCQSETAERLGIHNMPHDSDVIENLKQLCLNVLNPAIVHFDLPLFVTSGYRCPLLNAEVGGLADSQHLFGQAADVMMGGIRNDQLAKWIIENTDFDEVILEKFDPNCSEYGWVHASYNEGKNRNRVMTFDGKDFHEGFHYFDLSGSN